MWHLSKRDNIDATELDSFDEMLEHAHSLAVELLMATNLLDRGHQLLAEASPPTYANIIQMMKVITPVEDSRS
jgi:hypothetical protein